MHVGSAVPVLGRISVLQTTASCAALHRAAITAAPCLASSFPTTLDPPVLASVPDLPLASYRVGPGGVPSAVLQVFLLVPVCALLSGPFLESARQAKRKGPNSKAGADFGLGSGHLR